MRVRVLSPYPDEIAGAIRANGDQIVDDDHADWVVCYGHRQILRDDFLSRYQNRVVNLHISYLPWNRGSDPNFWSWYDATPKGVTLHLVDPGIDTGPVLMQREVQFASDDTLITSYVKLRDGAAKLFAEAWAPLVGGVLTPRAQRADEGSSHRSRDKDELMKRLPLGLNTPCADVERLGSIMRKAGN